MQVANPKQRLQVGSKLPPAHMACPVGRKQWHMRWAHHLRNLLRFWLDRRLETCREPVHESIRWPWCCLVTFTSMWCYMAIVGHMSVHFVCLIPWHIIAFISHLGVVHILQWHISDAWIGRCACLLPPPWFVLQVAVHANVCRDASAALDESPNSVNRSYSALMVGYFLWFPHVLISEMEHMPLPVTKCLHVDCIMFKSCLIDVELVSNECLLNV